MLMIYSPAGTEGMFAAMHALTQEQLMNAELTRQLALKHDTVIDRAEQGWPRQRHDFGLAGGATSAIFILGIINSDSRGLPWRVGAVRFPAGHPSSALPDTDGRHDRPGHGRGCCLQYSWLISAGPGSQ